MGKFIEKINKKKIKILRKDKIINESGEVTQQGVSLLVCLESSKLYEEMDILCPGSMEVVYRFAEMFIDENKHEALLDMIKEIYLIVDLPEPQYLDSLYELPSDLVFYTEEMTADWGDYLLQESM